MAYRHFRAVLFDFFGTLTRAIQRGRAHDGIARSLGCEPAEFFSVLDRTFHIRSTGSLGTAEETLRWVCAQLGVRPSDEALREACAARVAALRADTWLRPDAMPALWALQRRGLRVAVVSDCGYELPQFLPDLPIAELLDATVYSVHIGACKPHEAMYLAACVRLGVTPWQCLYVGDGGSHELTGAESVGMTAVRLLEADLAHHLTFDAETDWAGRTATSLLEAVTYLDGVDTTVGALVPRRQSAGRPANETRTAHSSALR
jgi:putative hydrolase of the HAD superfamily